ncbi:MAG: DUF1570 domain-containing protein [Planctomycetota bacterium]|nr:DUF1570 domain-containing protein [Planctomycetota bacterium]
MQRPPFSLTSTEADSHHWCRERSPVGRLIGPTIVMVFLGLCSLHAFMTHSVVWGQGVRRGERRNDVRPFQDRHLKLRDDFLRQLHAHYQRCLDDRAGEETAEVGHLIENIETLADDVERLPREIQPPIDMTLPAAERARRTALLDLRKRYAADLFALAATCKRQGHLSLAYDLIREAAVHNSDHPQVRKLLGYVRHDQEWVTPVAQGLLKQHKAWHPEFGWIPKNHVERYEKGQRYFNGSWVSPDKEAELRRDFRKAWEIRTDHYLIKTNHSLERGVELGLALEEFYSYFMQAFNGFFNSADDFPTRTTMFRPYVVHYYRTSGEYYETLRPKIPQIEITNGLYYTSDRIAYFFDDPNANGFATLYHEASHQLFYESQEKERAIADSAHFWIVEGIACYLESFHAEEGHFSIGDPNFERFRAARRRLLDKNEPYYVPLAQFSSMGMKAFQADPRIAMNYSQASGLAHFFMNYDRGVYRDALIEHLKELYEGPRRNGHRTLEDLTGVDFETLDRQYQEYLTEMDRNAVRNAAAIRP